jgi:hypothetical protein
VSSSEVANIGGVGLDVEWIQSLCCGDVCHAKMGIIKGCGVVDDVSEPVLPLVSLEFLTKGEERTKEYGKGAPEYSFCTAMTSLPGCIAGNTSSPLDP